jgi:hypothetical protein
MAPELLKPIRQLKANARILITAQIELALYD